MIAGNFLRQVPSVRFQVSEKTADSQYDT